MEYVVPVGDIEYKSKKFPGRSRLSKALIPTDGINWVKNAGANATDEATVTCNLDDASTVAQYSIRDPTPKGVSVDINAKFCKCHPPKYAIQCARHG